MMILLGINNSKLQVGKLYSTASKSFIPVTVIAKKHSKKGKQFLLIFYTL